MYVLLALQRITESAPYPSLIWNTSVSCSHSHSLSNLLLFPASHKTQAYVHLQHDTRTQQFTLKRTGQIMKAEHLLSVSHFIVPRTLWWDASSELIWRLFYRARTPPLHVKNHPTKLSQCSVNEKCVHRSRGRFRLCDLMRWKPVLSPL